MKEFILSVSIIVNLFLVWYVIQLLRRFLTFQEELDDFALKLEEYTGHLDIVNSLERFYGDETLGNLLRHSKSMTEECDNFKSILLNPEAEEEEFYAEEEEH